MNSLGVIREAISNFDLTETAHIASNQPDLNQIYAPASHHNALDPRRALVVGNRGVGKSFWSAVLAHDASRLHIAPKYPRLPLASLRVQLGFHEAAGKREDLAPSAGELAALLSSGYQPLEIWRAVLLRSLASTEASAFSNTKQAADWVREDTLRYEHSMRTSDGKLRAEGSQFLLVFDAIDRLGSDWPTIRLLSEGILRLALDVRGYTNIRVKVFMRVDQASDDALFRFPDASKIRTERVSLVWGRRDLYGMLFHRLLLNDETAQAIREIATSVSLSGHEDYIYHIMNIEWYQAHIFSIIAGEYMGVDARRGRTYSWLHGHLADAFEETSPRSFLTALKRAAEHLPPPVSTSIDAAGLKAGVQAASEVRVQQLKEDFEWIASALRALEGLEVPCHPQVFIDRWREKGTVADIERIIVKSQRLGPIEFESATGDKAEALLASLQTIGVIERRSEDRINMPDLFRVEARIKRRGGVKPPAKPSH